jgi:ABC-2 type transport system ATP-binding protein
VIRLTDLTKRYGKFTAVDGITLEVSRGELFGLLGPNGAGKTTTIRMIAGILQPPTGSVRVGGVDMLARPLEAKARFGFIPDRPFVYDKLTGG